MSRERVIVATFLSFPPGIGITFATLRVTDSTNISLAVSAGVVTTLGLFVILLLIFSGGSVSES